MRIAQIRGDVTCLLRCPRCPASLSHCAHSPCVYACALRHSLHWPFWHEHLPLEQHSQLGFLVVSVGFSILSLPVLVRCWVC